MLASTVLEDPPHPIAAANAQLEDTPRRQQQLGLRLLTVSTVLRARMLLLLAAMRQQTASIAPRADGKAQPGATICRTASCVPQASTRRQLAVFPSGTAPTVPRASTLKLTVAALSALVSLDVLGPALPIVRTLGWLRMMKHQTALRATPVATVVWPARRVIAAVTARVGDTRRRQQQPGPLLRTALRVMPGATVVSPARRVIAAVTARVGDTRRR